MPQGTNRTPVRDSDRLALLERELSSVKQTLANLLRPKPRTHWSQVRLAQTIDEEGYSGTGQRHPIVFVDAIWDTVEDDVDLTAKSAEPQGYALTIEPTTMEVGTYVFVEQTEKGYWIVVDADHGLGVGETDSGGIGAGFHGVVTAKIVNEDGTLSTALDDESDPITETVYNVFSSNVGANATIIYGRDKRSGRLIAIAEDCPS